MTAPLSPDEQAIIDAESAQWGKWKAIGPIDIDGIRAFSPGHDVPVFHVEHYGLLEQGLVEPADAPVEPEQAPKAPKAPPVGQTISGDKPDVGAK